MTAMVATDVPWAPDCMPPGEWADWRKLNARVAKPDQAKRPCADCMPSFAAEMRAENRCNGIPMGGVSVDELETAAPRVLPVVRQAQRADPTPVPPTRLPAFLGFEAPCSDCLHDGLCAIQVHLGMKKVELRMPDGMPPEVSLVSRLSTALDVECSRYLDRADFEKFQKTRERQREHGRQMAAAQRERREARA